MTASHRHIPSPIDVSIGGGNNPAGSYRYGFNGMESDDEVSVGDGSYDFGARMYDARYGRFLSIDPMSSCFLQYSAYGFALNNPILYIDHNGEDPIIGQLAVLPNGQIKFRLYWASTVSHLPIYDKWILNGLTHPSVKMETALINSKVQFVDGLFQIASSSGYEDAKSLPKFSGKGAGALVMTQVALDAYKSVQEIKKEEIRKEDEQKLQNYQGNVAMVSYYLAEARWLFLSFNTAIARNVFKDDKLDKHGENLSVDLVNYILLKKSGFLSAEKNQFSIYGNMAGLTREEYLKSLDEIYMRIDADHKLDNEESFDIIEIKVESKLGDNVVSKVQSRSLIVKIKDPAYSPEPIAPERKDDK